MSAESNFYANGAVDEPPKIDTESNHLSDFESPDETVKEVRGVFVRAMVEGLRETSIKPDEGDIDFSTTNKGVYRDREYMLSKEGIVNENIRETSLPNSGKYICEEKYGLIREMCTVESSVDTPDAASDTVNDAANSARKVRETVLSIRQRDVQHSKESILSMVDGSGNSYDLNELLPGGVKLIPADLDTPDSYIVPSLELYRGISESKQNEFSFSDEPYGEGKVVYGKVTTNSGLLSFLHETAHAWQSRFHPTAIDNYQYANKIVILTGTLYHFERLLGCIDQQSPDLVPEEIKEAAMIYNKAPEEMVNYMKRYVVRHTGTIEALGVTIKDSKITVENDSMRERVKDYVWVERQAWSTALKAYNKLKEKGLVPEPNSTDNLTDKIDFALFSYQRELDFIGVKADKPFSSKSTSHTNQSIV